ncbi:MAG: DUF960 domain-containing protein [Oscillospiraceae bacterium]
MFENSRYLTKGVNQSVPLDLQIFIWKCIDELPIEKDYLQVFNLSVKGGIQIIRHKQEVPKYQNTYFVLVSNPVDAKIFVIDDGEYSTMLLAEEY